MAAGEDDSAATSAAGKTVGKPCRLVVYNKAGDVVGTDVTADSFMDFKRRRGKHTAMVVELICGKEIFVFSRAEQHIGRVCCRGRARYPTGWRMKLLARCI